MGLAFWRSKKRPANAGDKSATRPPPSHDDDADARLDPAAGLRARARHRLIGAAALLLAVAIVVPMLLDPDPKPVSENIPIDIPSERTPFTPRLSLPPVPAADAAGTPPPDQAPVVAPVKADARGETRAEPKTDAKVDAKPEGAPEPKAPRSDTKNSTSKVAAVEEASPAKQDESKAAAAKVDEPRKAPETSSSAAAAKAGKFAVQAAAPASESAARELVDRLKKGGFTAYTEKVETKDGTRYRVRIGPYGSRDDAEKARARLKSQGISGNLVTL